MTERDENAELTLRVDVTATSLLTVEVAVTGEIDMATATHLRSSLMVVIDGHRTQRLTVDISGVALLDATGMTALVQVFQYAQQQHIDGRLINARPLVAKMIEVGGLTHFLGVTDHRQ